MSYVLFWEDQLVQLSLYTDRSPRPSVLMETHHLGLVVDLIDLRLFGWLGGGSRWGARRVVIPILVT